jgi:hypothetical protein
MSSGLLPDDLCRVCFHGPHGIPCTDIDHSPGPIDAAGVVHDIRSVCGCEEYVNLEAQSRIVVTLVDPIVALREALEDARGVIRRYEERVPLLIERADTAEIRLSQAEAALKRAYTILCSVQPAAHRATLQSPNDTALRLNKVLEDAIQEWVDAYRANPTPPPGKTRQPE